MGSLNESNSLPLVGVTKNHQEERRQLPLIPSPAPIPKGGILTLHPSVIPHQADESEDWVKVLCTGRPEHASLFTPCTLF